MVSRRRMCPPICFHTPSRNHRNPARVRIRAVCRGRGLARAGRAKHLGTGLLISELTLDSLSPFGTKPQQRIGTEWGVFRPEPELAWTKRCAAESRVSLRDDAQPRSGRSTRRPDHHAGQSVRGVVDRGDTGKVDNSADGHVEPVWIRSSCAMRASTARFFPPLSAGSETARRVWRGAASFPAPAPTTPPSIQPTARAGPHRLRDSSSGFDRPAEGCGPSGGRARRSINFWGQDLQTHRPSCVASSSFRLVFSSPSVKTKRDRAVGVVADQPSARHREFRTKLGQREEDGERERGSDDHESFGSANMISD